jgi:hypothetical protein
MGLWTLAVTLQQNLTTFGKHPLVVSKVVASFEVSPWSKKNSNKFEVRRKTNPEEGFCKDPSYLPLYEQKKSKLPTPALSSPQSTRNNVYLISSDF